MASNPFRGVDRRLAWLRLILLISCGVTMLACRPLWLNSRVFPVLPITPGFPILPSPWDKCFFAAMLLMLVLAFWFYRAAVKMFLVASLFAFCEDQNRGQPWFYMYWVMLLLTLWPDPIALAASRCATSAVYIWSGFQKCSPHFFHGEPAWFVGPAANWHLPALVVDLLRWAVATAPFVELGIGLALWSTRLRHAAITAVLLVHGTALLFLGPLGHNYNLVVWPWNLSMIALVCVLFAQGKSQPKAGAQADPVPRLSQSIADLRQSRTAATLVALYSLLPILSYLGLWDSYFSFALYSENAATANIFITQSFADRLSPDIRAFVRPFPRAYDPQFQGPLVLAYNAWCYRELHVPFIPEPRVYRAMFRYLRAYSRAPGDLRLIIGPRFGPVLFYEDDRLRVLTPK
jgi:hypothetical protein